MQFFRKNQAGPRLQLYSVLHLLLQIAVSPCHKTKIGFGNQSSESKQYETLLILNETLDHIVRGLMYVFFERHQFYKGVY